MKNYITIILLLFLSHFTYGQTRSIKETLLFLTDKSELSVDHKSTLDQLLDTIKTADHYFIEVSGHTDSDGGLEYNAKLSEKRANSVVQYFIHNKIPDNKIGKSFFGETRPINSNNTEQEKQNNRRVDILIKTRTRQTVQTVQAIQDTLVEKKSTIWELYEQTVIEPQEFCVNIGRDTFLRCEQGTVIYIEANSFNSKSPSIISGCITIQVKEVLLKSDMILENLSTTSNGQIIESQGMIYVNAESNGESLALVPGKDLLILVPTDTIISGAKIFNGNRNPHDSIMNWTINNNSVLSNFTLPHLEYCSDILCAGVKKCPFFFCKINNFFRKVFGSKKEPNTQRDFIVTDETPDTCKTLAELFQRYGVNDLTSLIDAINEPLYKRFNVDNFTDLKEVMEKEKVEAIELNYKNKKVAFEDFKYYVYNISRLGWTNVDVFADLNPNQLTTLKVNVHPDINVDVKLVFKNRNFVLPASEIQDKYIFKGVPKGEEVWVVAVKYDNGTPYLSMTEVAIEKKTFDVDFMQLTFAELQQELKKLDRE